jgi:hypothetical protein
MTHAFFKALLFLGAGSVIVAMHHEQDIRKMGGLKTIISIIFTGRLYHDHQFYYWRKQKKMVLLQITDKLD